MDLTEVRQVSCLPSPVYLYLFTCIFLSFAFIILSTFAPPSQFYPNSFPSLSVSLPCIDSVEVRQVSCLLLPVYLYLFTFIFLLIAFIILTSFVPPSWFYPNFFTFNFCCCFLHCTASTEVWQILFGGGSFMENVILLLVIVRWNVNIKICLLFTFFLFFLFLLCCFWYCLCCVKNFYLAVDLWSSDLCREQVWTDFECAIHPEVTLCIWGDVKKQKLFHYLHLQLLHC